MLIPSLPDWKVETIGDDICWMKFGADGRLYAINPEAGFFGVAPGTNFKTNPNAMLTLDGNANLHQYRPHRRRRCVVGGSHRGAAGPTSPPGRGRTGPRLRTPRPPIPTLASLSLPPRTPAIAPEWQDPAGVPIDAIHVGGGGPRWCRWCSSPATGPWRVPGLDHVLETTAAATGAVGKLRRDPFAMLPFCGYNMADYFAHWLDVGASADPAKLPKIFYVNWFRKDEEGRWLLARLRGKSRVLSWVFDRAGGDGEAEETPIGFIPASGAIRHRRSGYLRRGHGQAPRRGHRGLAGRGAGHPRALRQVRRQAPAKLNAEVDRLEKRLG